MRIELPLKEVSGMTHPHMHPISELAVAGFTLITVAASRMILADAPPFQQYALQWLLLPLIGALCASVCAMLLNPSPEARKVVLGRSIFGVIFGTAVPKFISMVHPALREWSLDPAIAFLAGFVACLVTYILAKPLVRRLYQRSGPMSEEIADHFEDKLSLRKGEKATVDNSENRV